MIQQPLNIEPTPQDKGLTLTLQVSIYDQGMVSLDGIPHESIAGAYIQIAHKIYALETQAKGRKRNRNEGTGVDSAGTVDSSPSTT